MALIIETGTGVANANSYISKAELESYAEARNVSLASYSAASIEGAIVVACTDFLNTYYTIKGEALTTTQGLQIPTDEVGLNSAIKQAACAASIMQLQGLLMVDAASVASGLIASERKKLDVLETEVTYVQGSQQTYKRKTPLIDNLMRPHIINGGFGMARVL